MPSRPEIAVVGPNALVNIGLKSLLGRILPTAEVAAFADFESLVAAGPERFVHFFVAAQTFGLHDAFFRAPQRRTIVLTDGRPSAICAGMHTLDVRTSEEELVRSILRLHGAAHPRTHLAAPAPAPLTDREREVLALVARGFRNKQIAERLQIGLTTVITHRRNLAEKLGIRSVAELTLYAVTAGLVDTEQI